MDDKFLVNTMKLNLVSDLFDFKEFIECIYKVPGIDLVYPEYLPAFQRMC